VAIQDLQAMNQDNTELGPVIFKAAGFTQQALKYSVGHRPQINLDAEGGPNNSISFLA
jgi:hypothetical protein